MADTPGREPIGTASARERGALSFWSIDTVENVGADVQLVICDQNVNRSSGELTAKYERGYVRLTAEDQARLIEALNLARATR